MGNGKLTNLGARRGDLLARIYTEALEACAPERLVFDRVEPRDGDTGFAVPVARFGEKVRPRSLWVFGAGKAVLGMAHGLLGKLGPQVKGGVLIAPSGDAGPRALGPLEICAGTHPRPSSLSVKATARLLEVARQCAPEDHAIFLLSGGASALLEMPVEGVSLDARASVIDALMAQGAPIEELNCVRKHLSAVKGGQLAAAFACPVTVLVFSDVAGNSFETIGSGPLHADATTRAEAEAILKKRLRPGDLAVPLLGALRETPKTTARIRHVLLASGETLAQAAAEAARRAGLARVELGAEPVVSEVAALARQYAARALELATGPETLVVRFGEPVVEMRGVGPGKGGRSQQLALALARALRGAPDWSFLAAGSDGVDGSSGAAGAVVDGVTWEEAERLGLKPAERLAAFDAEPVHAATHGALVTGPTGNNLQDLHLLLAGQAK